MRTDTGRPGRHVPQRHTALGELARPCCCCRTQGALTSLREPAGRTPLRHSSSAATDVLRGVRISVPARV